MTSKASMTIAERLEQLMQHLDIEKAHVAGMMLSDWGEFATTYPDKIASLTVISWGTDRRGSAYATRLAASWSAIGDQAPDAEEKNRKYLMSLPGMEQTILQGHAGLPWDDVILDYRDEVGSAMMDLMKKRSQSQDGKAISLAEGEGEVAGITYKVQGAGPPLILLPLCLSPSQWTPLFCPR